MSEENTNGLQCPACPEAKSTVSAWKNHMTREHGGWSDDQLRVAVNPGETLDNEAVHLSGEDSFESFAATLPEDARDGFSPTPPTNGVESDGAAEVTAPQRRAITTRAMKARMKKFKNKLSRKFPSMFFDKMAEAKKEDSWRLTKDEQDDIADAIETVLDVLDVEFAIEPLTYTVTSVWYVLLYPVVVIFGIFLMKQEGIGKEGDASNAE